MSSVRKIAFIVRRKTANYAICAEALRALKIPSGFSTELVTIEAKRSIAADRQEAMLRVHADYKVYIEDSAILLDENFIYNMVEIFQNNKHIGLLGAIGTNIVPTNGIAISSASILGEIYDGQGHKIAGNKVSYQLQEVKSVIGVVMITQYDIDWPIDYCTDFFYDTAHSLEYQHHGYKCAVIGMSCPLVWKGHTAYDIGINEQDKFLDQYSSELYPLVSIIIPSYQRPAFLAEAIDSVLRQTYRNLDVFVSDRSYDMESENMVKTKFSHDTRLHYVHHNLDRKDSYEYAVSYNNPKAEFVNWLMDDDLFAPEKIARMIDVYRNDPSVALVTSYRKCIDANGGIIPDLPYTRPLAQNDFKLSGNDFGKSILCKQLNLIGELSTCLIKKEHLYNNSLGCFTCDIENALSDVTTWIRMCTLGDVVYLTEPLSYVRIHDGQDQRNPRTLVIGTIYWALLLDYCIHHTHFLDNENDKNIAIKKWLQLAATTAVNVNECEQDSYYKEFKKIFSQVVQVFAGEKELNLKAYYH